MDQLREAAEQGRIVVNVVKCAEELASLQKWMMGTASRGKATDPEKKMRLATIRATRESLLI